MDNTVIVALISLVGTLGGSFAGVVASSRLTNYRIQQLEEKVNKHNQVVERVYELEKHNEIQDERFGELDRRVGILEGEIE